ncbi:hypothetical protein H8356DRAFT_1351035 [Neocallimastix lanati (nom. inval.)]|nr:hypothetical protein H8356DRAFT_1351035 [Neocallimastix sp. JGI-2020a]
MDNKIYNTTESVNYKILSRTQKKKIYNINNKYKEINNDRNYQYFKRDDLVNIERLKKIKYQHFQGGYSNLRERDFKQDMFFGQSSKKDTAGVITVSTDKRVSKKYCIYSMKNNKNEKKISNLSECVNIKEISDKEFVISIIFNEKYFDGYILHQSSSIRRNVGIKINKKVDTRSLPRIDESQTQKYGNLESIIGLGGKVNRALTLDEHLYDLLETEDKASISVINYVNALLLRTQIYIRIAMEEYDSLEDAFGMNFKNLRSTSINMPSNDIHKVNYDIPNN